MKERKTKNDIALLIFSTRLILHHDHRYMTANEMDYDE